MYEIVILVRDAKGNIIYDENGNPKRKLYTCQDGNQVYDAWIRNGPAFSKRKKGKTPNKAKEISNIVNDINKYAETLAKKKRNVDV